jgi:hypothetical protein
MRKERLDNNLTGYNCEKISIEKTPPYTEATPDENGWSLKVQYFVVQFLIDSYFRLDVFACDIDVKGL